MTSTLSAGLCMKPVLNKPKIAVLLAAYNGRCWLQPQVDSILSQKGVDVTVFASVDSSTDGTECWFDQLASQDSRVIALPHGQRFGGAAPNFFRLIRDVDLEPFDYVSFTDQDDIWHLDKLKRATEHLVSREVDAYSSSVTAFWPSGKETLVRKSQPQRKWDYLFEAAGPGCTYVIKKTLMLEIKDCVCANWERVQEVHLHDWFCYAYARAQGYHWYIDPQPGMLYRQHEENQIGVNNGLKAFIYRFKEIVSGGAIEQSALIAKLVGDGNSGFVKMWSNFKRGGFLRLSLSFNECRRKKQDRLLFLCACLFMAAFGKRI
jgi:rhamnosyltransferase